VNWPDLDFNNCEGRLKGKGKKTRDVPLLVPLIKVLKPVRKDIGPVFKEMHPDTVSKKFKKVARACDVDARLHDLRHSCASYLLNSGVRLAVVQAILGHESITTTQKYAKIFKRVIHEEMSKLRFR
jgi:integrase